MSRNHSVVSMPTGSSMEAAGKTRQVTVTDAADVAIQPAIMCERVVVGEDPSVAGWPTTAFEVRKPGTSDDPHTIAIGSTYTFSRSLGVLMPGDVVGYVRLVSGGGSTTFFIDEEGV